jgi:hypothetical protein
VTKFSGDFWLAVEIFKIHRQVWIFIRVFVCFEPISDTIKILLINIFKNKVKSINLHINKGRKVNYLHPPPPPGLGKKSIG